jgi:beta-1,4-N-acetylglucosaminyltransferase
MAEAAGSGGATEEKVCFVTTGATAPFTGLIESVLQPSSIDALLSLGYTHLLVQHGIAKDVYEDRTREAQVHLQQGTSAARLTINGIDFDTKGLKEQFQLVQKSRGLVISHAGSGSILEALRYQVALIAVPNTALLDNHQEELAAVMERSNYLIRGDVKYSSQPLHAQPLVIFAF